MSECIMVGCDLHDKSMLLKIAVDRGKPMVRSWGTSASSQQAMMADLHRRAKRVGASRIVLAYEACGFGFRMHDELTAGGIETYVLAPSRMERSAQHRKRKTDERDAQLILDIVRSYVLAGVEMPSVWIPGLVTRDDRELVRLRLSVAEDAAAAKTRVTWLLKRNGLGSAPASSWTLEYWRWLEGLKATLLPGASGALASLMRKIEWLSSELARLDAQVLALSREARYESTVSALCCYKGVAVLTAMVYLTEIGDLSRFANRRQISSFLGLTPCSFESGEQSDRKGHITRHGSPRVRKVLCQSVWSRLKHVTSERLAYDRIVRRNPKHKKIAVVARMRALGVKLWHTGLEAQMAAVSARRDGASSSISVSESVVAESASV